MDSSYPVGTLATNIGALRRQHQLTQEQLAEKLGISFQAVSKWENGQSCPDIAALPALCDIFGVTVDALFGREARAAARPHETDWSDDGALHIAVFKGTTLLRTFDPKDAPMMTLEGGVMSVDCRCNLNCGDVLGNANACGDLTCNDVGQSANASGSLNCGDVGQVASAGGSISCGDVGRDVSAGGSLQCGDVGGRAEAGGNIECGDIGGSASCGGSITCGEIKNKAADDEDNVDSGGC